MLRKKEGARKHLRLTTVGLLCSLVVAGTALGIGVYRKRTAKAASLAETFSPAITPAGERLEARVITIRPTGFDPTEIQAPGRFLLAVDNKSGLSEVALRLAREDGTFARDLRISSERYRLREKLTLRAGTYSLSAANHANWVCRITVAP